MGESARIAEVYACTSTRFLIRCGAVRLSTESWFESTSKHFNPKGNALTLRVESTRRVQFGGDNAQLDDMFGGNFSFEQRSSRQLSGYFYQDLPWVGPSILHWQGAIRRSTAEGSVGMDGIVAHLPANGQGRTDKAVPYICVNRISGGDEASQPGSQR